MGFQRACHVRTLNTGPNEAMDFVSSSRVLVTAVTEDGQRYLRLFSPDEGGSTETKEKSRILWQAIHSVTVAKAQLSSMMPLELDVIVQGYSGYLRAVLILLLRP